MASRRALLTAAGASVTAGTAALLAGCGSHGSSSTHAAKVLSPAAQADVHLLNRALDVEQRGIAAYTAAIPLLSGRAHADAKRFLAQELSHAAELGSLVAKTGAKPIMARASYDLGHPKGPKGLLRLLEELENLQIGAYLTAVANVSTTSARSAVASMLADDAQHVSVIRLALHRNPVPSAFVSAGP